MWEIFDHPIWTFIAIISGITIPIIIYLVQRSKKGIGYTILSCNELIKNPSIHSSKKLKGRLEILYNGQPVSNVYHILIRIFNSGNVPIRPEDYELPLKIDFGKKTQILRKILSKSSEDINVKDKVEKNVIKLNKFLFNKGESIKYSIFLADYTNSLNISGRIAGINKISEVDKPVPLSSIMRLITIVGIIPVVLALILMTTVGLSSGSAADISENIISLIRNITMFSVIVLVLTAFLFPMSKILS